VASHRRYETQRGPGERRPEADSDPVPPSARGALVAAPPVEWTGTFGLSYTDAEDGSRTWLSPLDVQAEFKNVKTSVDLYADGYGYSRSDGDSLSGFTDPTLAAWHKPIQAKAYDLAVGGGITVPVHGDLGGEHRREFVGAVHT